MKIFKQKKWLIMAIFIISLVFLTLIAAPANNKLNSGSTYGRSPDGYGAWYAFMKAKNKSIERWQKPFLDLMKRNIESPITLLKVNSFPTLDSIDSQEEEWVKKGNNLIILGVSRPATDAPFTTFQYSDRQTIKIETTRREKSPKKILLGDKFGAVVWEDRIGKGKLILASNSYLAANAYQDYEGNYEFLEQLVSPHQESILVDEYIHGYKDMEVIKNEHREHVISYLFKTPILPILLQSSIILAIAILSNFFRFGKPLTIANNQVDNSEAYIQALAGVLRKAESTDFVWETLNKEEQLQLQKSLGLGEVILDRKIVAEAWAIHTGKSAQQLEQLLQYSSTKKRWSESELINWLEKWQAIKLYFR